MPKRRHTKQKPVENVSEPSKGSIELRVVGLSGEGLTLNVDRSTLGQEVYRMVSQQLPPKRGTRLDLYHMECRLVRQKTLSMQGLAGATTLSCIQIPINVYDAWCYVRGFGNTDESALHGVTDLDSVEGGDYLLWLPETLERLTFGPNFNQSLKGVTFPNSLRSLTFDRSFNRSLQGVTLPSGLQSLTFGISFNHSLQRVTLPSGLKSLTFDGRFNHSLQGVTLPSGLQSLTFGTRFNKSLQGVTLPSGLQSLTFGWAFNQSMEGVTLPSSLQSLTFGFVFNQSLQGVGLPSGLQSLTFGDDFNQSLQGVTLPSGLQSLTFGDDFNKGLQGVTLPSGLQSLTFGISFNRSLQGVTLPSGLQSLTFGTRFNKSLQGVTLPSGLQILTLSPDFNQSLNRVTVPKGLKSLTCYFDQGLHLAQNVAAVILLLLSCTLLYHNFEKPTSLRSVERLSVLGDFNESLLCRSMFVRGFLRVDVALLPPMQRQIEWTIPRGGFSELLFETQKNMWLWCCRCSLWFCCALTILKEWLFC